MLVKTRDSTHTVFENVLTVARRRHVDEAYQNHTKENAVNWSAGSASRALARTVRVRGAGSGRSCGDDGAALRLGGS